MITLKEHLIRQKVQKKLHEDAIDLSLPSGTLWCSHNVGTEIPEVYGDYFAWGETKPKKEYTWETYKFGTIDNITKYNDKDNKTQLDLEDDAAYVNLEQNWHIPSVSQIQELMKNCEITYNDKYFELVSNKNNNKLIFPFSFLISCINSKKIFGQQTFIVSNELKNTEHYQQYKLLTKEGCYWGNIKRASGCVIRPVKDN